MNPLPPNTPAGGPAPAPVPPPRVPDHELLRRIGRGAYGEVWLARSATGAFRAVKIVSRASFDHARPFEREFEGILKFEPVSRRHDSQVDILHVGRAGDGFYYVMELADDQATGGQIHPDSYAPRSLKSDLQFHGRLPFEECVRIGLALATALEHLHANGLVHRDVKPSNIIFVNGVAKLADIGLVTGVDATRSYVGTEGFAAPEGPGTVPADLYSLGKVIYEIATGKDRQEFPELPTKLRELPDLVGLLDLNAVIARACRHDPQDRYASAAAMRADLELLQSGKSLARLHRLEQRLRIARRVGVLATILVGVITVGWLWQARQTREVRELAGANSRLALEKDAAAGESLQRLIQMQTANGLRAMEENDPAVAALWFAEVLELSEGDAGAQRRQRDRIGALFGRMPKPVAMLSVQPGWTGVRVSTDGRWLIATALSSNDGLRTGEVKIWDATSLQLLHSLTISNIWGGPFTSPSGRWAFFSEARQKFFWNVAEGTRVEEGVEGEGVGGTSAWSPDESRVATIEHQGTNVYLLAAPSGRLLTAPLQHPNEVVNIVFDPTGRWLATGTKVIQKDKSAAPTGQARVWDAITGEPVTDWIDATDPVYGLDFNPDGSAVALFGSGQESTTSGFSPKHVHVIDLPSGEQRFPALKHGEVVISAVFSPDGRYLATGSADGVVTIWDARIGDPAHSDLRHRNFNYRLRFSPDGTWLAAAGELEIQLWNVLSGKPMGPPLKQGEDVFNFNFTPDGDRLLTVAPSGKIRLWDLAAAEPALAPFVNEIGYDFTSAVFSPDGRRLATADSTGDLRVWDVRSGLPLGNTLIPAHQSTNLAHFIDNQAAWSPDGRSLVVPSGDNNARVWDVATGTERLSPLRHQDHVLFAEFSPDGQHIVTASKDFTAQVWDARTGEPSTPPLRHGSWVGKARFSPDGLRVVTASSDGTARVWETYTGKPIGAPIDHGPAAVDVMFNPDGTRIAIGGKGGFVSIHDANTGLQIGENLEHTSTVLTLRFSPDGRRILTTSSMDTTARVWDAETGQPIAPVLRHDGFVVTGSFSPDGDRVITGGYDGTARIWDAATGEPMGLPLRHDQEVLHVDFSPDGRLVCTTSLDGTAQIWEMPALDWGDREIAAATRLLAGGKIGVMEGIENLTAAQTDEAWASIAHRFQLEAPNSSQTQLNWHRRRMRFSETAQDWYAAKFHARRLVELQPGSNTALDDLARINDAQPPARDPSTPPELIDLSGVYNASLALPWHGGPPGNHFAELPRGVQTFAGTGFDVRGLVQVIGDGDGGGAFQYPKEVKGIRINRKLERLQILHSIQGAQPPDGTRVGHYQVHFTDGRSQEIPIIYGRDARDWHEWPNGPAGVTDAVIAWVGHNPANKAAGTLNIRLFKSTWENPAPDVEILSVDFVAEHEGAYPFLVALTAE